MGKYYDYFCDFLRKFYINNEFYKFNQVVNYGDTILISTSETIEDLGHSCFYNRNDLGLIGGEQILLKPNTKLVFEKYLYWVISNEVPNRKTPNDYRTYKLCISRVHRIACCGKGSP